jgi:hypothetical protein
MAYKNGKTALNKRDIQIRDALAAKDIASLLWIFLEDSVNDIESGKEPRYGLDMFKNTLTQVAQLQAKGVAKPQTDTSKALQDFLNLGKKNKKVDRDEDEDGEV